MVENQLMDNVPVGVMYLVDGQIRAVNRKMQDMFGFSSEEFIKLRLQTLFLSNVEYKNFQKDIGATAQYVRELILKGKTAPFLCRVFVASQPKVFWAEEEDGAYDTVWIIEDIVKQEEVQRKNKEMQHHLIHSSKLASIGTLVAGVAHEINNPLMIIDGYVRRNIEWAMSTPHIADTKLLESLEKQQKAVKRIISIVNGLRTFAHIDEEQIKTIDVHAVVTDILALVGEIYKKSGIILDVKLEANMPFVQGDIQKLQQVIVNLLTNAKDALEGINEPKIGISTLDTDKVIIMKISDNGCGISPAVMNQIFDPFFTTKAIGQGTGLGLSISQSLIDTMGGMIDFQSKVGVGTVFTITLPKG